MKNLFIIASSLILSGSLFSCSDKEDTPENPTPAKEVAGIYTCSVKASAMGQELNFEDVGVTLEAISDNAVNVSVASFGTPPMQLPELNLGNPEVAGTQGNYTLESYDFEGTATGGKSYSGTLRGSVTDNLNLQVELHYGNMPMPLICNFTGTLK